MAHPLPSAIYFVAICSDGVAIQKQEISSVYIDPACDLFKLIENERHDDISRMQLQVQHTEQALKDYELQLARQDLFVRRLLHRAAHVREREVVERRRVVPAVMFRTSRRS